MWERLGGTPISRDVFNSIAAHRDAAQPLLQDLGSDLEQLGRVKRGEHFHQMLKVMTAR